MLSNIYFYSSGKLEHYRQFMALLLLPPVYIFVAMKSIVTEYLCVENFAQLYRTRSGKTGVSRQYIYQLIAKEENEPNSTDIDILVVDGSYFCKYRVAKASSKSRATRMLA